MNSADLLAVPSAQAGGSDFLLRCQTRRDNSWQVQLSFVCGGSVSWVQEGIRYRFDFVISAVLPLLPFSSISMPTLVQDWGQRKDEAGRHGM